MCVPQKFDKTYRRNFYSFVICWAPNYIKLCHIIQKNVLSRFFFNFLNSFLSICLRAIGISDPNSVADIYELIYNPLQPGRFTGEIFFSNVKTGRLWYKLNLVARPETSTVSKLLECMIGSDSQMHIPVVNSSGNSFCFPIKFPSSSHIIQKMILTSFLTWLNRIIVWITLMMVLIIVIATI